jgi:ammonia channel protein AmtB
MHQAAIDAGAHDLKRGTGMNLFDRHDTPAGQSHPRRRHAIIFAVAVVMLALTWLGFNALIRIATLD